MKKIIHIDMDAFFASVEQRDNPHYKNKPLIIGGTDHRRGVVSTCSYEARKYGVHSAMATFKAHQLCPKGIFINGNYDKYQKISKEIFQIISLFSDNIEVMGLDEAYIDVTNNKLGLKSATKIGMLLKEKINNVLNLTCSIGISYNKTFAKIASEYNKPNGIFTITPDNYYSVIVNLKIKEIPMIGNKTNKKLENYGFFYIKDLEKVPFDKIEKIIGENTRHYLENILSGQLKDELTIYRPQKSITRERTIIEKNFSIEQLEEFFLSLAISVLKKVNSRNYLIKTVTLKLRYEDFNTYTRTESTKFYFNDLDTIIRMIKSLTMKLPRKHLKIRLLGISVNNLKKYNPNKQKIYEQNQLF